MNLFILIVSKYIESISKKCKKYAKIKNKLAFLRLI